METREGKKWERYGYILALNLYFKLPFSKMSARNPEIIKLANIMERTNNSICLPLKILLRSILSSNLATLKACKLE